MTSFIRRVCVVSVLLLFVGVPAALEAENFVPKQPNAVAKQDSKTTFLQIKNDLQGNPLSMQTAIVRYAWDKSDVTIDLVGVVHIGEKRYYKQFDNRFKQYDCLLYELVAPKGTVPKPGRKSDNPLAMLQKLMTMLLQLEHQLECVDYTPANFVHADMTPAEMNEAMKKRGDTPFTLAMEAFVEAMRKQNKQANNPANPAEGIDPFALLTDPLGPWKVKVSMAKQMADQVGEGSGLGKNTEALLVGDRNKKCMEVLEAELKAGKKKIAIFYGAAHMPDFEKRLKDKGFKRKSTDWLDAWDLRKREVNVLEMVIKLMMEEMNK